MKGIRMAMGLVGLSWAVLLGVQGPELALAQSLGGGSIFHSYTKPQPVPDFSLDDLQGKMAHIKDYRGKVILLNFWATW